MKSPHRSYKYFDFLTGAFVTVLLCSNLIGAGKVTTIAGMTFGTGIFFFPFSYLFGDILTEVYGYDHSRRVIWTGFGAMIFSAVVSWFVVSVPPAANWPNQAAYEIAFGAAPRIVCASMTAFFAGEFANSFVLAKMKLFSSGKHLWMRTIGSTIVGEGVDSLIFYPLAFSGLWDSSLVIEVMMTNYAIKVLWEVFMTPVTYKIVNFLKKAENEDYFDRGTDFNPFKINS